MKIHPLWFLCLIIRTILILSIKHLSYMNSKKINKIVSILLFSMGMGFIYQGYFSSNKEIQIAKVFWHETRFIHGIIYILSGIYLYINKIHLTTILLTLDVLFSLLYRIVTNQ